MTTTDISFHDFWEASSLHELNAAAFGTRVVSFDQADRGVPAFAGAGAATALEPVRDRFQRRLVARRSGRTFTDVALSARAVSRILGSVGTDGRGNQLVPSAGGLAAVHTFGIGTNVAGPCANSLVRYDAVTHAVHAVGTAPPAPEVRRLFQLECEGDPQLILVFVADLESVMRKYGVRGVASSCRKRVTQRRT